VLKVNGNENNKQKEKEKPVFEGVGNLSYSCIPPHSFYNSFSFVFGIAKGKESIPAFIPNLLKNTLIIR